ncbi:MAG TPA: cobalt-precorrin-5B (C(1))-methyltransferase [Dongiaceae bacterium]|nr:cobalt-precorrin-5B (C(1))-methyltransferase [Dongiaceae bacterium]
MTEKRHEDARALRRGWTTGACALAAARACFTALLTGRFPDPVSIRLPRGEEPSFPLVSPRQDGEYAEAGIVKDAGDDPDVTHGCTVIVRMRRRTEGTGIRFRAGAGVGTITKPGLPLRPGEPAINPAPRAMITTMLGELAAAHDTYPDVEMTFSIPGGEDIARKTWNPRLGIAGGLSILGTTGIVYPYSCSAWIASIHRGIDVLRAAGTTWAGAATGSTSEAALRTLTGLDEEHMIDMGDFAGGMLKYLRAHPLPRVSIALGFGKGSKLACGAPDLHSARSQVDFDQLSRWAREAGAADETVAAIAHAHTALEALERAGGIPLGNVVARHAATFAQDLAGPQTSVDILLFDRQGHLVGKHGRV